MKKTIFLSSFLCLLCSCSLGPPSQQPSPNVLGLLKVTITGIGDGVVADAKAEWVKGGASSQNATVAPINGTNALGDVQISRVAVNFSDDDSTSTRYIYSTFRLTNRTTTNFANLTFYAVNVPTNLGGTGIASMTAATGTAITNPAVARGFQPIHAARQSGDTYAVNATNADLQFFTPAEATSVQSQAVTQSILTNLDTVLEYGFVARNLSGGRAIFSPNIATPTDCTDNSCKGLITLAYKFPKISPRQNNPFSFSLYFVVANETVASVSQSPEEQALPQAAGLTSFGNFSQVRNLAGTGLRAEDKLFTLCRAKIALSPNLFLGPNPIPTTPGSLDVCFGAGGIRSSVFGSSTSEGNAIAVQSDGKIVVAGDGFFNGNSEAILARYNPDGTPDTSFDGDGKVITPIGTEDDFVSALAIQSDGKIVVAGFIDTDTTSSTNFDFALVRYNANGSLDTTFDGDGKLITAIGSSNDRANDLAIQSDGKFVVAGSSRNSSNNDDFALARYNSNGSLDISFNVDGKVTTAVGSGHDIAFALAIQSNGRIVVAGSSDNGTNLDFALARYNSSGFLDTTFDGDGKTTTAVGPGDDQANDVAIQADGKIVVAGFSNNGSNDDFALARYNINGALDTTFDTDGKVTTPIGSAADGASGLTIQSDGKIIVAGYTHIISVNDDFALARYNSDGSLDLGFDGDGLVTTPIGSSNPHDRALAIALQSDGKIVVSGVESSNVWTVARYNP